MAETTRRDLTALLPRLEARARRLCRNESDAQDLVQEAVLRALAFRGELEEGTNLAAWLLTILRNAFISRCRRQRTRRRALEELSAAGPALHASPPLSPEDAFLSEGARRALASLPESFARAVELVDLGGHAYQDAADEMGVPLGTVMSRLHRGRRMLAQLLLTERSSGRSLAQTSGAGIDLHAA